MDNTHPPSNTSPEVGVAIGAKTVTYDFHRLMEGATKLKCSEFGDALIAHMDD